MEEEDKGFEGLTPEEVAKLKKVKEGSTPRSSEENKQEAYSNQERASFQTLGANTLQALTEIIPTLWKEDDNPYNLLNYLARLRERETYWHELTGGEEIGYLIKDSKDANIDALLFTNREGRTYDEVTKRKSTPPNVLQVDLLFTDLTGKHPMSQANFPRIHETVVAVAKKLGFVRERTDPSMIQPERHDPQVSIMHGFDNPKGGKKPAEPKPIIYNHLSGQPYTMEFMFHNIEDNKTVAVGFRIEYTPKKPSSST